MSGIYIKDMEMPKPKFADMATIYDAYILVSPDGHTAIVVDDEDGLNSTEYSLISIPEHGDLIDRDKILVVWQSDLRPASIKTLVKAIWKTPTIIPADEEE